MILTSVLFIDIRTYDSDISLRSARELPAGPAILLLLVTPRVDVTGWGGDMCNDL